MFVCVSYVGLFGEGPADRRDRLRRILAELSKCRHLVRICIGWRVDGVVAGVCTYKTLSLGHERVSTGEMEVCVESIGFTPTLNYCEPWKQAALTEGSVSLQVQSDWAEAHSGH